MSEALEDFRDIETASGKDGIHEEALKRFREISTREEESRMLGIEDLAFVDATGGQYDQGLFSRGFLSGNDRDLSENDVEPPRYEVDRISPVIEEAVNDQREAQINIRLNPTGPVPTGLADTMGGLIKNIEVTSDAQDAYDNAYDECQKSGYGGWQIVTEYVDDGFEQRIAIEPILNATQSLFFGPAKKATKEDALYAFVVWDMDKEEFQAAYPEAAEIDWPTLQLSDLNKSWFNARDNLVRVAAYWRKKPVKKTIIKLQDRRVIDQEDYNGEPVMMRPDGSPMIREVDSYEVERYIMSGDQILKGPQKWAGRFIPLIPEYGVRSYVNRREIIRGRVRKGKDSQRVYNYTISAIVEAAAQSPKDFHWMTPAQAEGHVEALENMNVDRDPVYFYNPDQQAPGAPVKAPGPTVQNALIQQAQSAKEDIAATVGSITGPEDGTAQDRRSGEAIIAGQEGKEKGNGIYFTNHIRAIAYTGVQLADLIPRVWTGERQERIIKPDGSSEFVTVNQTLPEIDPETGRPKIQNNLAQSHFDVVVDVGPAYASQRQRGADTLTKLATENSAFASRPDLIAKNLDIPGGDELHKTLRRDLVLAGRVEPTDEEREEFGIDQRAQIAAELEPVLREQITQEAQIQLLNAQTNQLNAQANKSNSDAVSNQFESGQTAAETQKTLAETENTQIDTLQKTVETMAKMQEVILQKLSAGIPLTINETDNLDSMDDIVEEQQQEISPGPNSAQRLEFGLDE